MLNVKGNAMKKVSNVALVRNAVSADMVSRNKLGNVVVRRGYFYTNGATAESFRDRVSNALFQAGVSFDVVDYGNHWAPFRGGAGVTANSHFYVELKVIS
jgi:hypothetical protein